MRCDLCLESLHLADEYHSDGLTTLCRDCWATEQERLADAWQETGE